MAATAPTPPPCGTCRADALFYCIGCGNMPYCSFACQALDKALHNSLCASYKALQNRPSDNHYRAIHIPGSHGNPYFLWLEFKRCEDGRFVSSDNLIEYLGPRPRPRPPFPFLTMTKLQPRRKLTQYIHVYHQDASPMMSMPNQFLVPLIGEQNAACWRGSLLAQGIGIATGDELPDQADGTSMPLDLDTTSLPAIVSHMKGIAQCRAAITGVYADRPSQHRIGRLPTIIGSSADGSVSLVGTTVSGAMLGVSLDEGQQTCLVPPRAQAGLNKAWRVRVGDEEVHLGFLEVGEMDGLSGEKFLAMGDLQT